MFVLSCQMCAYGMESSVIYDRPKPSYIKRCFMCVFPCLFKNNDRTKRDEINTKELIKGAAENRQRITVEDTMRNIQRQLSFSE